MHLHGIQTFMAFHVYLLDLAERSGSVCKLLRKRVKVIAALSFSKMQHYAAEDKIVCRLTALCVFLSVPKKLLVFSERINMV